MQLQGDPNFSVNELGKKFLPFNEVNAGLCTVKNIGNEILRHVSNYNVIL